MEEFKGPSLSNLRDFGAIPKQHNELLQSLGAPHVESFNYMTDKGLDQICKNIVPAEFAISNGDRYKITFDELSLEAALLPATTLGVRERRIFPTECREGQNTYKGKVTANISVTINDVKHNFLKDMGEVPIMVRSNRCHLHGLSPKELVKHNEHENEWGGYFIVSGNHRLIRLLQQTRRNYPIAIQRKTWKGKEKLFSEFGVKIRCVTDDQTTVDNTLHFVTDGTAKLTISVNKRQYLIPIMLIIKSLGRFTDHYIYEMLIRGHEDNLHFKDCMLTMLRRIHEAGLHTNLQCKTFLGEKFRIVLRQCPPWYTNLNLADHLLDQYILVHLDSNEAKVDMLVFMIQKLFIFAQEKCLPEGVDALMMQEILLGGHLYMQVLKEYLQRWLRIFQRKILDKKINILGTQELAKLAKSAGGVELMEKFLAQGELAHDSSGLGLMQTKGLTIPCENINMTRYMAHFRSIHRGSFFLKMRTTEARRLLPDAYGFVCPVNTPDGGPCGLLNHLTLNCIVTDCPDPKKMKKLPQILGSIGMVSLETIRHHQNYDINNYYIVMLDGKIWGYVHHSKANKMMFALRKMKIEEDNVPKTLEIAFVPSKSVPGQFPGLFLFTGPARLMRPVYNIHAKQIELIGSFEQVYMEIAVTPEEIYDNLTTRYLELSKTSMFSNLAQLIPLPDCNQAPRNMYQCQMSKQTMGTPLHTWRTQAETKMFRLQTPSSPLFRPAHYDRIKLDDFAVGTNAVVAIISYTGFDMEDALIINKASFERGFGHGSVYKSKSIELDNKDSYFERNPKNQKLDEFLDTDGLPFPGRIMKKGDPFYCYYEGNEHRYIIKAFDNEEESYIDNVRLIGSGNVNDKKKACIVYRVPRNPMVGDKFASRAGQKGICSFLYPTEEMPFTTTGMVPDIIFNPHSIPSRMTIAMMIELMAGKSASIHGHVYDATPFKFNEKNTAIDYFGRLLEVGGFNYHGTETMYSGITGGEMKASIFFGVVYYQRLRHMVSDKWQARSIGAIDAFTKQPIKGRKRGGGVRFGEMERDCLISHGAAFLLQDRLFHNSDKTTILICTSCKTLVGPIKTNIDQEFIVSEKVTCRLCDNSDNVEFIEVPYIFKLFVNQMLSVNINVKIDCSKF